MLDSGNRGFVHSFDAQSSDLIEYRSPVLKAMIDRAMGSAESLTITRTSESATLAPPGAIRVEHVQGATPARGKEKVGMVSRASFDKGEEYVVALECPGMSLVNR